MVTSCRSRHSCACRRTHDTKTKFCQFDFVFLVCSSKHALTALIQYIALQVILDCLKYACMESTSKISFLTKTCCFEVFMLGMLIIMSNGTKWRRVGCCYIRVSGYTCELHDVVFHLCEWQLGEDWACYLLSRPFTFSAMATSRPKKSFLVLMRFLIIWTTKPSF